MVDNAAAIAAAEMFFWGLTLEELVGRTVLIIVDSEVLLARIA
jgi:hypothetical protein